MENETEHEKTPIIPQLPPPKVAKMLRRASRKKYCQIITIREGKGEFSRKFEIPASARDNRTSMVMLAAKFRKLLEDQIDTYTDTNTVLTPEELVKLAQAAERCGELSYRAHGDVLSKEKLPELPPVPVQNNQTNIGTVVMGGGQSGDSFGNLLSKVGDAAARATPVKPDGPAAS